MDQDLQFHEAANLFPMMTPKEEEELMTDIKKNGQLEPIRLYEGKILDGRNRYLVCLKLGIQPKTKDLDGEIDNPVSYVLSTNLYRRNLSVSQKALIAENGLKLEMRLAKERMAAGGGDKVSNKAREKAGVATLPPPLSKGKARDAVGKAAGVSGRLIQAAAQLKKKALPETIRAVEADKLSISTAVNLLVLPVEEQRRIALDNNPKKAAAAALKKNNAGERKQKEKSKPSQDKADIEHKNTKQFAMNCAHWAITQLKLIPLKNTGREDALLNVENWCISERNSK